MYLCSLGNIKQLRIGGTELVLGAIGDSQLPLPFRDLKEKEASRNCCVYGTKLFTDSL